MTTLSTPPKSAVIRVNINLISLKDAIETAEAFLKVISMIERCAKPLNID